MRRPRPTAGPPPSLPVRIMHLSVRPFARRAWLAGLASAVVGLNGAVPPPAKHPSSAPSLDALKQDLQELKQDGAAARPSDALDRIDLPQLHPADDQAGPPSAKPPVRARPHRQLQKEARNWLLDAMRLMDANRTDRTRSARQGDQSEPAMPTDPDDPDYLLKVYLAQQPSGQTSARDSAGDTSRPTPLGTADFDHYLARWLSPNEVKLFGPQPAGPDGVGPPGFSVDAPPDDRLPTSIDATAGPNPYLENLRTFLTPPPVSPPPAPAPSPPAVAPPSTGSPRTPMKPPPGPEDDKKYFPQLDRF